MYKRQAKAESIIGLDDRIEIIQCSLEDIESLPRRVPLLDDGVFYHLAWNGGTNGTDLDLYSQNENVLMGLRCMEAASKVGCSKFIGIGSVLDLTASQVLERSVTHPSATYAVVKDYLNKMLKLYSERLGIDYVWCRLSGVYGPNDRTMNLISYAVQELLSGRSPIVSEGSQWYSFVHVEDCARALYHVGDKHVSGISSCFIGGNEVMRVREFLSVVQETIAPHVKIEFGGRPDDGVVYDRRWFDLSSLQKFGYQPCVAFEEGIVEVRKALSGSN